jgi:hypothetical protein
MKDLGHYFKSSEGKGSREFIEMTAEFMPKARRVGNGYLVLVDVGSAEGNYLLEPPFSRADKIFACEGNTGNYNRAIENNGKAFKKRTIDFRLADAKDMRYDLEGKPFIKENEVAHMLTSKFGPAVEKEACRILVPGGYYLKSGLMNLEALTTLLRYPFKSEDKPRFQKAIDHARKRMKEKKNGIIGLPLYEERMAGRFRILESRSGMDNFYVRGEDEADAERNLASLLKQDWMWGPNFNPLEDKRLYEDFTKRLPKHQEKSGQIVYRGLGSYIICAARKI